MVWVVPEGGNGGKADDLGVSWRREAGIAVLVLSKKFIHHSVVAGRAVRVQVEPKPAQLVWLMCTA